MDDMIYLTVVMNRCHSLGFVQDFVKSREVNALCIYIVFLLDQVEDPFKRSGTSHYCNVVIFATQLKNIQASLLLCSVVWSSVIGQVWICCSDNCYAMQVQLL